MLKTIKTSLLGCILILTNIFTLSAADIPGAPYIYTACLDCGEVQVEEEIRQYYLREFASHFNDNGSNCGFFDFSCIPSVTLLASDNWVYFTDLDNDKGLKFSGSLNSLGQINITRNYSYSQIDQDYLENMHQLRFAARQARINIQADLDALTGTTKNQSKINQLTYESDDNGKCENNSDTSSVFDYLIGSNRNLIDSNLRTALNSHTPNTVMRLSEVNFSLGSGRSASLGIAIVFEEEIGSMRVNFGNGNLVFIVQHVAGDVFNFSFNLNASQVGFGISDNNGTPLVNLPLSTILRPNGSGGYTIVSPSDITFSDPCLAQDFLDLLETSAVDVSNLADSNSMEGCQDLYVSLTGEFRWRTYVMRLVAGVGSATITRVAVEHSRDTEAERNKICGGG